MKKGANTLPMPYGVNVVFGWDIKVCYITSWNEFESDEIL